MISLTKNLPIKTTVLQSINRFLPSNSTITLCIMSYLLVLICAALSPSLVPLGKTRGAAEIYASLPWYHNWDGLWYRNIVEFGYFWNPESYSSVVFYPLYPLLAKTVALVTGLSSEHSLLTVNTISLLVLCGIWEAYARQYSGNNFRFVLYALCLLLLYPAGVYLRVAYPMALVMALLSLLLYGFRAGWRIHWLMILCIILTSCHSTGFALIPALGWYSWKRLGIHSYFKRLVTVGIIMAMAGSGLWLYMLYQWHAFGNPFYFMIAQKAWKIGDSVIPSFSQLITLYHIWEPLTRIGNLNILETSRTLFNHGLFMLVIILFFYGTAKRWISSEEIISTGFMIMLFYYFVLQQGEQGWSTGRYSMLFMPCYLVAGRILLQQPRQLVFTVLLLSEILMGWYTMFFARWQPIY